jgi:hypothetical protein
MRATHLVTAAAAALALAGCRGPASSGAADTPTTTPPPAATSQPPPAATSQPPPAATSQPAPDVTSWGLPADASAAARAAGLPMLGGEKLTVHYHAHLDVLVDGRPVPVPADIGIDEARGLYAPLHTHDDTGVIHIESATDKPFTLGQLFTEWGQPLRTDQVGPDALGGGTVLRVYRNGQPVTGDPAALRLAAHDEVVVWVGPAGTQPQVPASYAFPPGE